MSRRLITAEDLKAFKLAGDPQFSPDGAKVLFSVRSCGEKNKYVTQLHLIDLASGNQKQWTQGEGGSHGRFTPDGSHVAFLSGRSKPLPGLFVIPTDGGEPRNLIKMPEGGLAWFKHSPDGKWIVASFREQPENRTSTAAKKREEEGLSSPPWELTSLWNRLDGDGFFGDARFHLYLINAETGEHKVLFDKDAMGFASCDWLPDSSGLIICHSKGKSPWMDLPDAHFSLIDLKGKLKPLKTGVKGPKGTPRVSPDGKNLAWLGTDVVEPWGAPSDRVWSMPIDGSSPAVKVSGDNDLDFGNMTLSDCNFGFVSDGGGSGFLAWSPDGTKLYSAVGHHGEVQLVSLDPATQKVEFLTKGEHMFIPCQLSSDGGRVVGILGDTTHLPEVAVVELGGEGTIKPLTKLNAWVNEEIKLSHPEPHWIDSTDGVKVQAWVMNPPELKGAKKKSKKGPGVLTIHGGPHTQYGCAFFHEFQLMAAQGWTVVFSNPRGSRGYGEAFCRVISGDWGHKDWDDIQAVTKWMKSLPGVDSSRLGVMGGSYGGYMTNWVIGHCHDFRAAITDRCVSNWISMIGTSDFPMNKDEYFGGTPYGPISKIEPVWKQSPMSAFDKVQTPTLIIHSEGDLRCPIEQGDQVFAALQARGIESRFVRYPANTSHGLSRNGPMDMRQHRLGEILSWWKKHLD